MPQTLLALLALTLSSFLVFNQQRLTMRAQTNMVGNELSLAGSGLASDILEMIGARSFDEQSTPEKIHTAKVVPESPTVFTSADQLGKLVGQTCNLLVPTDECDDIDDVNNITGEIYTVQLAEDRSLDYRVSTKVVYVTDAEGANESSVPTRHKKVTLTIAAHNQGASKAPIVMERVFSYDPIKAEMDYERIYGPIGTDGPVDDGGDGDGGEGGGTVVIN